MKKPRLVRWQKTTSTAPTSADIQQKELHACGPPRDSRLHSGPRSHGPSPVYVPHLVAHRSNPSKIPSRKVLLLYWEHPSGLPLNSVLNVTSLARPTRLCVTSPSQPLPSLTAHPSTPTLAFLLSNPPPPQGHIPASRLPRPGSLCLGHSFRRPQGGSLPCGPLPAASFPDLLAQLVMISWLGDRPGLFLTTL